MVESTIGNSATGWFTYFTAYEELTSHDTFCISYNDVALEFLILCGYIQHTTWIRGMEIISSLRIRKICYNCVSFFQVDQINRRGRRVALVAAFVTNSGVINIPLYTQCEREMKIPHCNPSVPLLYNGKGT
jgi:hypothetical protein